MTVWFRVRPRPFWTNHRAPIPARPRPRLFPLAQALRRSSPGSHGFLDLEFGTSLIHSLEFSCCDLFSLLLSYSVFGPPRSVGRLRPSQLCWWILGCQG